MKRSMKSLTFLTLIVFGSVFEIRSEVRSEEGPGDCLQYPVYFDDVSGLSYWLIDQYVLQTFAGCQAIPNSTYYWDDPELEAPEVCGTCIVRTSARMKAAQAKATKAAPPSKPDETTKPAGGDSSVAKANDQAANGQPGLGAKLNAFHRYKDHVKVDQKLPGGQIWHPRAATTVLLTQWARVQTEQDGVIFVKLYVVQLDFKAGGHPAPPPNRILRIGFEMDALPPDLPPRAVALIRRPLPFGNRSSPNSYGCQFIYPDDESEQPFTVVTHTPVFRTPK